MGGLNVIRDGHATGDATGKLTCGKLIEGYGLTETSPVACANPLNGIRKENLAPYKAPVFVDFRDELPKSQVGKILHRILVEAAQAKQAA